MAHPPIAASFPQCDAERPAHRLLRLLAAGLLGLALIGCEREPPPPTPEQQAEAEAAEAAGLYHQLRELDRLEQAELAGRNVLEKYPDTAAAAEVRQTYESVRAQVEQERDAARLSEMWVYHAMPEGDGVVYTATIHRAGDDTSTEVSDDAEGVRLVLRRHPEWGQAVYLLVSNGDFECAEDGCEVAVVFDDSEPEDWEATMSREGPLPALFIEDDERFIEAMGEATWVEMDPPLASEPVRPVRFEVGGFDEGAWLRQQPDAAPAPGEPPADAAPAQDATDGA